ncbi:MAG TPA: PHP domain-containing protein [Candidatus Aminicenantes bacterium]|nr:PHP domain-containing protein [Candidatus Aminicenantes bacterium]
MELRRLRADLHIHTCLSPCGELAMSPRAVVEAARAAGLDLIAVTDHNTTENAAAVARAAAGAGPAVLPGIELTTAEEAHILGLFEAGADLAPFQAEVFLRLPQAPSKRKFIKDQVLADAEDRVVGFSPRCLFGATELAAREAVDLIRAFGGLAVASHIDREAFSLVSQLGFIPPGLGIEAVEVSPRADAAAAREAFGVAADLAIVRFSDAHRPEEIGAAATDFLMAAPTLAELRLALAGRAGRKVLPP